MTAHKILVGSYTRSIYTLEFDPAPSTAPPSDGSASASASGTSSGPTLKLLSQVDIGPRPSWIEPHPSDKSLVFAGLELVPDGKIVVVKYDADGRGTWIEEATCSSGGADPCTLLVTENELLIGNYSGSTLATIPISTNPPYTRHAELWTLTFPFAPGKPGRDASRQEMAHPHQAVFNPLNTTERELLVPDLGSDKVWQLTKGTDGHWAIRGSIDTTIGGGPRHVAIYGNTLYILLELMSELAVYRFHPNGQTLTHLTTLSTIKLSPTPPQMNAAEILIPKPNGSFSTPCIYISNREDPHHEGDTVAIFSLEKGEERPELVAEVRTGMRHLRGMAFGGEDDRWLIVGGTGSGADTLRGAGVKVYERVDGGRGLRQVVELDSALGRELHATAFLWL